MLNKVLAKIYLLFNFRVNRTYQKKIIENFVQLAFYTSSLESCSLY